MLSRLASTGLWFFLTAPVALAQGTPPPASGPDFTTGLWTRGNLLGDAGGLRSTLWGYGITFGIQDFNEAWGNVSGGIQRGASYDGVTLMSVGLDTLRAFGWQGGTFNISAWNIRGRSISTDNLLNLQTVSGILASPTTRLWEIWFQQSFLDGRFDVKVGQQSIDQEFMVSQYSAPFLNTVMGWPMVPSADLYAGGPAYPLSSLGVRLRGQLGGGFAALGGVFQDNPPGGPFNADSQLLGSTRWGGNFNLRTGALFIAELQYALNQPRNGDMDYSGTGTHGLPGTYKIGMWFDTAAFPSPRFDNTGLSLADPASTGIARTLRNNFSVYGVVDQMIWRPGDDSPRSVGVFARIMGAPGDRNLINFSVDAGVALKAPLPGRDHDSLGVGFGIAKVSSSASAFDSDTAFFSGTWFPVRGSETFIEVTYQIQATGWWQLQPDFQYVFNPGGGIQNPNNPTQRVGNEAIFGLRSVVTF
jgi:porin